MANKKLKTLKGIAVNGIVKSNPTFRLVLGMCPTLAVTTSLFNSLGMGLATTFVLVFSNMLISLLRNIIPDKVRIPAYILIIATFVIIIEMLLMKFLPDLYDALGIFISLIVVNCIIFARAESFASVNPVLDSAVDGLSTGLGFTLALSVIGGIRELFGQGKLFGAVLLGDWFPSMTILILPAGGFLVLGLLMAAFNAVDNKIKTKKEQKLKSIEESNKCNT